jgi:hypothetical protein
MSKTLKEIQKSIDGITSRGKKLRFDCHTTLVDVIDHYIEHGDTSLIPKLLDAVKNSLGSSLSAAMIDWTAKFVSSLNWDNEKKAFAHVPKVEKKIAEITAEMKVKFKSSDQEAFFVGNARDFPFYELEREAKQEPFDLQKAILQLVKRAETALEHNIKDHAHNKINSAQVDILKTMAKNIVEVKPEEDVKDEKPQTELVKKDAVKRVRAPRGNANSNKKTTANPALQVA